MNFDTTDSAVTAKKKIGRKLKPSDPDFVAPDGGWGWLVVFACGLSNLSILSMYQQFGLVFTDKFREIGFTHTQTTTILNINLAFTSCVGLFNGPIYRRFTFRQVALVGSSLVVSSLLIVTWCTSFWTYFTFYSIFFGISVGLTQSANALALNTYFKEKRTIATGLSWGTTGIGPIVWPYVITLLLNYYGMEGTVLLFAGFAGHAIMCSLLLQPVHWHTKCREETKVPLMSLEPRIRIVRSNSLPVHCNNTLDEVTIDNQPFDYIDSSSKTINAEAVENTTLLKNIINTMPSRCHKSELNFTTSQPVFEIPPNFDNSKNVDSKLKTSFFKDIIIFFDLDILKDLVYINIIYGMISICFVEFNLAILTPVILKEFSFEKYQIATYLSLLGAMDVLVRFSISFVARKIKWSSRTYFLLGTLISSAGRMVLIHTQQFHIALFVAVVVGFGKGLIIIYLALLIPNHVSLKKLPAALGIYLATFGILLILMAPVPGWIRDITGTYVTTVHILHIFIYLATLSWIVEDRIRKRRLQAKLKGDSK